MDTYPYFIIKFKETEEEKSLITETYSLIPSMMEIEKRGGIILEVQDNNEETYTKEEILGREKEKIDKLYEDKNTILEIYNLAYHHFHDLWKKHVIYEKEYEESIKKLQSIQKEYPEIEEFKEEVKKLYFS